MTKPLGWIAATVSVINLLITSAVWSAVERIEIVEPRAVFSVKGGMSSCDVVVALSTGSMVGAVC